MVINQIDLIIMMLLAVKIHKNVQIHYDVSLLNTSNNYFEMFSRRAKEKLFHERNVKRCQVYVANKKKQDLYCSSCLPG